MKAWELLSDESKWTKLEQAKGANGLLADPQGTEAVCFCAYGAIKRCYGSDFLYQVRKLERHIAPDVIGYWNDTHTWAEVHAKLKALDI